jgi:hypothetical protein
MEETINLKEEYSFLFDNVSDKHITALKVPKLKFLMIDGIGDPNESKEFINAIKTLFTIANEIRENIKKEKRKDFFNYTLAPLEGLWWTQGKTFKETPKNKMSWTLMLLQPNFVNEDDLKKAKKTSNATSYKLNLKDLDEGECIQIIHKGPYSEENNTINKINKFIKINKLRETRILHKIYLTDLRKTSLDELETIIRVPIKKI